LKKNKTRYQRTFEQVFLFIMILSLQFCGTTSERHEIIPPLAVAPDNISTVKDIPETHKAFLARFLPEIHTANNQILTLRNQVLDLQDAIEKFEKLSDTQQTMLKKLISKYRLDPISAKAEYTKEDISFSITALLKRLDIIPVKLVMAQAIIESGWGGSGFAKNGNNYFGVHCYTEGCGVKPAGNDSADFYVKTYRSEMAGIEDYLWILNTGHAYRGLRDTRLKLRDENKAIDPIALAQGLSAYSTKGEEYVKMVSNIIKNYIPENTDDLLTGSKP
jgi:Bax protein